MNRSLTLILSALFFGAVMFYLYQTREQDSPRSSSSASPADSVSQTPADPVSSSLAPAAAPAKPLAQPITVPEHLQNPHALAPEPLKLRFAGPPFDRQKNGRIHKTDVMKRAADLNHAGHEPDEDLHILRSLVDSYRGIFQQNPVAGENWEVVAALTGKNLHQLVFIDPSHPAINEKRELLDRWGTPFRFHPISGTRMEFSSAGPDRQFGSSDDINADEPILIGDRGTGS